MLLYKKIIRKNLFRFFKLCLIFILFQSCKTYQDPISFEDSIENIEGNQLKMTMKNGDKFIYEDIEVVDGLIYGIHFIDGKKIQTLLDKDNIKDVQFRNKNSSKGSNFLGIGIGILSVISGLLMF